MALLTKVFRIFGFVKEEETKFKTGDHVERIEGGELMVVESVSISQDSKSLILRCKWFDSKTRQNKVDEFSETQIRFFNWYRANRAAC
jgi:uncharacterized protein YodC (DUF2158 family)